MTAVQWANKTIPASDGKSVLKTDGKTDDIVAEVIAAFKDSREQLMEFAPHLKAAALRQTLLNVWTFWKYQIKYKVDPPGQQWIQEPKALWARKEGDCKSLSLAVMATLYALDIKAAFRFTSYGSNSTSPTHVYVVVLDKGKEIPVDCVWKEFGTQKPFKKNWDYNMTAIYRLSGLDEKPVKLFGKKLHTGMRLKGKGKLPKRGVLHLPHDKEIAPHVCDMLLKKQRLELEQKNHVAINGIGTTYDRAYEMQIAGIHNALAPHMGWPTVTIAGFTRAVPVEERNDHAVSGIDCSCIPMDKEAATVEAIGSFFGNVFKGIGKGLKAVGKAVGKGAAAVGKGVFKVVSAPVKLIGKGVMAAGKLVTKALTAPARNAIVNDLPQLAPFFLYTFITDPRILAKLPPLVNTKRNKALEYRRLLTGKLQISESNFTGTVRNGILLKFGDSPENVIAAWIKSSNYQIGIIDVQAVFATAKGVVSFLPNLLRKFMGNLGENLPQDAEQYAPAIEDWGGVSASTAYDISNQPTNMQPLSEQQLYNNMQQYQQQQPYPQYNIGLDFSGGGCAYDDYGQTGGGGVYPDAGSNLARPQTMDEVVINPGATQQSSSTGLLIAAAGLGLLLMTAKKGKK